MVCARWRRHAAVEAADPRDVRTRCAIVRRLLVRFHELAQRAVLIVEGCTRRSTAP